MIPRRFLDEGGAPLGYQFARNFWTVVKALWPTEFLDGRTYKLQTTPGTRGLSRFGRRILLILGETQEITEGRIRDFFKNDPSLINWGPTGPLARITGKGGEKDAFDHLIGQYGSPSA